MSTATLSKSQRKKLRRQMEERKKALLAKHGRSAAAGRTGTRPSLPKDPPRTPFPPPTAVVVPAPVVRAPAVPPPPTSKPPARAAVPEVRDLDAPGPGPLSRGAAVVEHMARRAAAAYRERPWQERPLRRRAEAHRTLARLVPPLRVLGVAAVVGAVALAREARGLGLSDTGALVVLGMSLGGAVVLLSLAEMARALQVVARR